MRDPFGFRPLVFGRNDRGIGFASETCALSGYRDIQDVKPGQMIVVSPDRTLKTIQYMPPSKRLWHCAFEWVYIMDVNSEGVVDFRTECGKATALHMLKMGFDPKSVDFVSPVLDSGRDYANALAHTLGLQVVVTANRTRHTRDLRAFMAATDRSGVAGEKLQLVPSLIKGKRVLLGEDSLLRSMTLGSLLPRYRRAGARALHVAICCPPIDKACKFGVNTHAVEELVASHMTTEEIRLCIGADSLTYVPLDAFMSCLSKIPMDTFGRPADARQRFCVACMQGGKYPRFACNSV